MKVVGRLRPELTMLRLSGPDGESWLQGQLTQDVRLATQDVWRGACLVNAKGQLEDVLEFRRDAGDLLILTERPHVIEARVASYVVLEDVAVNRVPCCLLTQAEDRQGRPSGLGTGLCHVELEEGEEFAALNDAAWEVLTLKHHCPVWGAELRDGMLPPEAGEEFVAATISNSKGCYLGQEVLARLRDRGRLREIVVWRDGDPSPGQRVVCDGEEVGRVIRARNGCFSALVKAEYSVQRDFAFV